MKLCSRTRRDELGDFNNGPRRTARAHHVKTRLPHAISRSDRRVKNKKPLAHPRDSTPVSDFYYYHYFLFYTISGARVRATWSNGDFREYPPKAVVIQELPLLFRMRYCEPLSWSKWYSDMRHCTTLILRH